MSATFTPFVRGINKHRGWSVSATLQQTPYTARVVKARDFPTLAGELRRICPKIDHVQQPDTGDILDTGSLSLTECLAICANYEM